MNLIICCLKETCSRKRTDFDCAAAATAACLRSLRWRSPWPSTLVPTASSCDAPCRSCAFASVSALPSSTHPSTAPEPARRSLLECLGPSSECSQPSAAACRPSLFRPAWTRFVIASGAWQEKTPWTEPKESLHRCATWEPGTTCPGLKELPRRRTYLPFGQRRQ